MNVQVYNISNNELPKYETTNAAGLDVRADFSRISPEKPIRTYGDSEIVFAGEGHSKTMLRLDPGSRALIPTGLFMAIPEGYECQVRPRSGYALKKGITVLNTPGTLDSDYRQEVGVILINSGLEAVWIEDNERIAQLVFNKVEQASWEEVNSKEDLGTTDRKGGFGHTGMK